MLSIKNLVLQMLSHLEKISTPSFPFLTCGHSLQVGAEPLPHVTEPWELMIDACIWINQSVTLCIPFLESYLYIVNSKIRKVPLLCYLGKPSRKKSAVFLNIVQKAFDPPPPFVLNKWQKNFKHRWWGQSPIMS